MIPGGKEKNKARQAVFLTPTNPFGNDPEEEEPHDDYTVPQKVPYVIRWKQFSGYAYQKRRTKDWNSGRRSHLQS